jgi:hypothetical protein
MAQKVLVLAHRGQVGVIWPFDQGQARGDVRVRTVGHVLGQAYRGQRAAETAYSVRTVFVRPAASRSKTLPIEDPGGSARGMTDLVRDRWNDGVRTRSRCVHPGRVALGRPGLCVSGGQATAVRSSDHSLFWSATQ